MSLIVKSCKIHGDLTIEQTRKDGENLRCKQCRIDNNRQSYYKHREKRISTSMRWKRDNRGDYNEWCRQDRIKNPDKYRRYEANHTKKYGVERGRRQEVLRIHGLKIEQHDAMIISQNNLCLICGRKETRKGRSGGEMPLCIDHCHTCEEKGTHFVRGLLCHSCNTGIGKFQDSIELLEKAIEYLKAHIHIE